MKDGPLCWLTGYTDGTLPGPPAGGDTSATFYKAGLAKDVGCTFCGCYTGKPRYPSTYVTACNVCPPYYA